VKKQCSGIYETDEDKGNEQCGIIQNEELRVNKGDVGAVVLLG
jgi:hypothetical protein